MYILDVLDLCKNITFLKVFMYLQILLKFIFIIVPIGLIIMLSIDFAKNVLSSDDGDITKNKKTAIQRIIMAIFLFAVPYIVSTFMNIMSNVDYSWYTCYNNLSGLTKDDINRIAIANLDEFIMTLDTKDEITSNDLRTLNRYISYLDSVNRASYEAEAKRISDIYEKQLEDKASIYKNSKPKSNINIVNTSGNSSGKGKILLIAGHSYSPYCEQFINECRGPANKENNGSDSPYAEEDLTRQLVVKVKEQLLKQGYSNNDIDIANELLGEDFNDHTTSKSMYGELKTKRSDGSTGSDAFRSINWKQYKFALEVHFNASDSHNATGPRNLYINDMGMTKKIDEEIRNEMSSLLGTEKGTLNQSTSTIIYFNSIEVPFSYLETEFYDNKKAIENYLNHIDEVAEIIAKNIKKYYP